MSNQSGVQLWKNKVRALLRSETLQPTDHAVKVAESIITGSEFGIDWSEDEWFVVADEDGGLSMSWAFEAIEVTVEVPSDASLTPYIYWCSGDESGVVENIGAVDLVTWMRRLRADVRR